MWACVCLSSERGGEGERGQGEAVWVFMVDINHLANVYYYEQIRRQGLG